MKKLNLSLLAISLLFDSLIFANPAKIAVFYSTKGDRYSTIQRVCMTMAVLNQAKSQGMNIEIKIFETQRNSIGTALAAQRVIDEGYHFVIGTYNSNEAMAASKILNNAGIPFIPPNATLPELTEGDSYVLRFLVNDYTSAGILATYTAEEIKPQKIITVTNQTNLQNTFLEMQYENRLKQILPNVPVLKRNIFDGFNEFDQLAKDIVAENPDLIFLSLYSRYSARLYNQLSKLNAKVKMIGGDGIAGNKRFFALLDKSDPDIPLIFIRNWDLQYRGKYVDEYQMLFRNNCGYLNHSFHTVVSYDSSKFLLDVIKKHPKARGRDFITKAKKIGFREGLMGPLSYDSNGKAKRKLNLFAIENSKSVFYREYSPVEKSNVYSEK